MDLLGPILNKMEKVPYVSTNKTGQIQRQKKTNTVPHFNRKLQQLSNSIYKCGMCGKSFTDKKSRNNCRNNHKKHRKEKAKKDLVLDREKDKNLTNETIESLPTGLGVDVDTLIPLINNNKQSSTQQMKVSDHQPYCASDFKKSKLVPSKKVPTYKCNLCTRIFMENKMLENHIQNHIFKKQREALKNSAIKEGRSLTNLTEESSLMKSDVPSEDNKIQSSVQQMEVSIDQPSPALDYQKKLVPPEEKPSYKCDICDRIFTKKKTYKNHKTNHNKNRNTAKHLFFERSTGK